MIKVSVILPFKNAQSTIERAVNSILKQTFKDFELVLIDDKSTDQSRDIVERITDKRVRLVDNLGTGLVAALKTGLSQAEGEYIARMDADDLALPQRLAKQYEHLSQKPAHFVSSCRVKYRKHPNLSSSKGYRLHVDWLNQLITPQEHYDNRFIDAPIAHPTLFCRKSIFDQYGSYHENNQPEDFELWLRWMANGVRFEKLKDVLLEWNDHEARLSRVHSNYRTDKFFQLKAQYFALEWPIIESTNLWVIGYGKSVFKRAAYLDDYNLEVSGYVDIKARPGAKRKVINFAELDPGADNYYLVYVSDRKGKKLIQEFFDQNRMRATEHYQFMA